MPLSREYHKAAWTGDPDLIRNYLVIEKTDLAPADLILAFGNRHYEPLCERAGALYQSGMAPYILVSGGAPAKDSIEASEMYKMLRDTGVPDHAILVEDRSLNTQQNVLFSKALVARELCRPVESVITVGQAFAGRRFLMTMAQNWPDVFAMASNVPLTRKDDREHRTPAEQETYIAEQFSRIAPYLKAGYIAEVDIAAINRRVRQITARAAEPARLAL